MTNYNTKSKQVYKLIQISGLGFIILLIGIGFGYWLVRNSYQEYMLIQHGVAINGFVLTAGENFTYEDSVFTMYIHSYGFKVPNGGVFVSLESGEGKYSKETLDKISDTNNDPIICKVQYLPDNPKINRIQNNGCQSILEWLWKKIGIGGLFLITIFSTGFVVIRSGLRDQLSGKVN